MTKLGNGSLWFEAVTSEDEGNYLCRATNGIGSGLGKVIYVAVKGKNNSLSTKLPVNSKIQDFFLKSVFAKFVIAFGQRATVDTPSFVDNWCI